MREEDATEGPISAEEDLDKENDPNAPTNVNDFFYCYPPENASITEILKFKKKL